MNNKLKLFLYGLSAFIVFVLLSWGLKAATGKLPIEGAYFGAFTDKDLMLGLLVAAMLTFSHYQKRKISNK